MAKKSATAAAATTTSDDRFRIEDAGPSRKKLTITIPGDVVADQLDRSMSVMMQSAALPGFRPGHVPRRLIEKRFGKAVMDEAKNQLVSSAYSEAIQSSKLSVLGDPEGAEELAELTLTPGTPVTFTVEIEVAPEFDLPEFKGITIKKPLVEVTEAMVDDQIERLGINEGALEPQESAQPGDYCIGHGVMKDDAGTVLLDLPGAVIQVPAKDKKGKGAILGIMVDDFGPQIGLPKPGDVKTIKATGPENHEKPEVRGKKVTIQYTVERVERIIPSSVQELVARYGMADETQLRETVKLRLNQRAMVEQQSAMRQQVAKHLLDAIEIALPEKLTAKQAERNIERRRMELLYRGIDAREVEEHMAELRAASTDSARRELKLFFILAKAAQQLNIRVTEEEVNGRIAQLAIERGVRPDQFRAELLKSNQVGMVVQQVREHKTMDAVMSKAEVSEVSAAEYNSFVDKNEGLTKVSAPEKG